MMYLHSVLHCHGSICGCLLAGLIFKGKGFVGGYLPFPLSMNFRLLEQALLASVLLRVGDHLPGQ